MNFKYLILFIISIASAAGMIFLREISLVFFMILSVSLALLTIKKRLTIGIIAAVISICINFAIGMSVLDTALCLGSVVSGLLLGICILKGYSLQGILTISAGGLLFSILFGILIANLIYSGDVISTILDAYSKVIKEAFNLMFQNPESNKIIPSNMTADEYKTLLFVLTDDLNNTVKMFLPFLYISFSGILTYINFGIVRTILAKRGAHIIHIPTFPYLKMGRRSGWVLIALWIIPYLTDSDIINNACINTSMIIMGLFAICATSLIDYKLKERIKFAWARIFIYFGGGILLISLLSTVSTILVMLGMADSIMDFRNPGVGIKRG